MGAKSAINGPPSRAKVLLIAVVAFGALLRFSTLGLQSFWYDEAATGYVVGLPGLGNVIDRVAESESTPPLYYVLTWAVAQVFGQGDIALRMVSAVAGTAAIPLAWATARRLADDRAGLIAAAFVAVSPLLLHYSQEARSYELLTVLCAASFYFTVRCYLASRPNFLVGWVLTSGAALATHYFAAFLLVPELALLLWSVRPRWQAFAAGGGLALVGLALLPLFVEQRSHAATDWISEADLATRVRDTGHQFVKGVVEAPGAGLGAVAFLLVGLSLVLVVAAPSERRRSALICLGVGGTAIVLPALFAVAGADVFLFRNLQGAWVPLAIGLAAGLSARRAGLLAAGGLGAVWLAIWVGVLLDDDFHRHDWKGAAAELEPPREDRALAISPGYAGAPLARYGHFAQPVTTQPVRVRDLVVVGVFDSRIAGHKYLGFDLVDRRQVQQIGIARYRAKRPVRLTQTQFAPPGSPEATPRLHLEPRHPGG